MENLSAAITRALSAAQKVSKTNPEQFLVCDISEGAGSVTSDEVVPQRKEKRSLFVYSSKGEIGPDELERASVYALSSGIRSVWFVRSLEDRTGKRQLGSFFHNPPFRTLSGLLLCDGSDVSITLAVSQCVLVDVEGSDASRSQEIPCRIFVSSSEVDAPEASAHFLLIKQSSALGIPSPRDLSFFAKAMSCVPGSGMKFYFLGDLADLVDDSDAFIDYEEPELVYSPDRGFRISTGSGLAAPDLLLDLDTERADLEFIFHWLSHAGTILKSDSSLSRRGAVFFPTYLPELHVQATLGRAACDIEKMRRQLSRMSREASDINVFDLPVNVQLRLAHEYRARLNFFHVGDVRDMPLPIRQLFSELDSPLHDSYSAASELIDFLVQFHSLVAASIGHEFTHGSSPLTRFFGENSYTDLGAWLREFEGAKSEFDKQFALIAQGKEPALYGMVEPWVLPYLSVFFSDDAAVALSCLRQIRNRKFAHSGSYSEKEKKAVVEEVKATCLQYFNATGPAWSILIIGVIAKTRNLHCWIKPLGAGSCDVEHSPIRINPESPMAVGDFAIGIRGSSLRALIPVFPAFYVLPAGKPDSDHLYFLSSMDDETQDKTRSYKFNCYTRAPWGERVFTECDNEISGLLRNIKLMEKSEYRAQLIISKDSVTGGFSFSLLHSSSLYLLSEVELAGSLSSYVNDKPLEISSDKLIPIPADDVPVAIPRENILTPGSSFVLDILRPQYDMGKQARLGLPCARYTKLSILIKLRPGSKAP